MTPPSNAGGEGREVLARAQEAAWAWINRYLDGIVHPADHGELTAAFLAFSARENAADRAAYTYDVTWSRADGEQQTCRALSPRLVTARIIQAIKTSGSITIHAVEGRADDRAPALVEAAVAEMRERAAKTCDEAADRVDGGRIAANKRISQVDAHVVYVLRARADAIRALGTPSQEASNVG